MSNAATRQENTAVARALLTSIREGRNVDVTGVSYDAFARTCLRFGGECVTEATCDATTNRFAGVVPAGQNAGKDWSLSW